MTERNEFRKMFATICERHQQKNVAAAIGVSPQYVSDLLSGRRLPSVRVVWSICDWMGRGPKGTREWHLAAARDHGWYV